DVLPFLENVTRGRGIPAERLIEVGAHYRHFGGVSPINAQNRELIEALAQEFARRGVDLPVYFGNRNWDPFLADALRSLDAAGATRVLALVTSAYSSYSGCRQYRENLAAAADEAGVAERIRIDKVRNYFDHPGFVAANVEAGAAALAELGTLTTIDSTTRIVFTTHSIPTASAAASGPPNWPPVAGEPGGAYVAQHRAVAALITSALSDRIGTPLQWDLVFQSRSGPPQVPWLEPDICDHLEAVSAAGASGVVIAPIGFISDHIEVLWDLDTEALGRAAELGLPAVRAATAGTHPAFVAGLADLVEERMADVPADRRPALTDLGPCWDACPVGCCPNPRGDRPALCGAAT
ncbi:MAG: ferrochelatase, partial [Candidatus Nanopelagicales bacterium]